MLFLLVLFCQLAKQVSALKQCQYEKSGYFVLLDRMAFDEAAMACVQQGAVLASYTPAVGHLIETCAEWEMDTLEPWIARRIGDLQCPFVRRPEGGEGGEDVVVMDRCDAKTRRPAVCWRYPIALKTITEEQHVRSTLTDYDPSVVATVFATLSDHPFAPLPPTTTTFTWTNTVTETRTKQRRVPRYLLEYSPGAANVTLTETVHDPVTIIKQVPSATVTEEELVVAVAYSTHWSTSFVGTETRTVSVNCI